MGGLKQHLNCRLFVRGLSSVFVLAVLTNCTQKLTASGLLTSSSSTSNGSSSTGGGGPTPAPTPVPTGQGLYPDLPAATTMLSVPPFLKSSGHVNDPLAVAGFLDVTLYGADPTGKNDSTKAIQNAINDAYTYSMVTYVPAGTYTISNTLSRNQIEGQYFNNGPSYNPTNPHAGRQLRAPSLVGPSSGPRPTIQLAPNSSGFSSPSSPKPMLHFFYDITNSTQTGTGCGSVTATFGGPNAVGAFDCMFQTVIRDINFVTGNNSGAIGVQFFSAQESYMHNVSVDATGGFAGVEGAPTTSDWVNISVTGGQYGILIDAGTCGSNSIVSLTLSNQTVTGFYNAMCGATVVSGFNFKENGVPAVSLYDLKSIGNMTTFTLIDGSITISGGTNPAIDDVQGISLYLSNVYVKAPSNIVSSSKTTMTNLTASGGMDLVNEYSHSDQKTNSSFGNGVPLNAVRVIDGATSTSDYVAVQTGAGNPPTDLVSRHLPGPNPWALDPGTAWVTAFGADPTGVNDSTAAIQKAINTSDQVFLPRGDYEISTPLHLKPNTRFFGIPGYYTRLFAHNMVTKHTPTSFIQTVDSASAKTYLADIHISMPVGRSPDISDATYISGIEWQAGQSSVLNEMWLDLPWENTTDPSYVSAPRTLLHVSNNGGGKFYGLQFGAFQANAQCRNPDFPFLQFDGTSEPTTLYGSNPEHLSQTFYRAFNSSNIRILGIKAENEHHILEATNSSNIMITGFTNHGNGTPPNYQFTGSKNLTLGNISYYATDATGQSAIKTDSTAYPLSSAYTLFKLGTFSESPFPHCGDGVCDGAETSLSCSADCH